MRLAKYEVGQKAVKVKTTKAANKLEEVFNWCIIKYIINNI